MYWGYSNLWIIRFIWWISQAVTNKINWDECPFALMGGGGTPEPPSPKETAVQSVEGQVENLPTILAAQKEFGPQFAQQQLQQIEEFGPQYAEQLLSLQEQYGPQIGEALRAEQEATSPELASSRRVLTEYLDKPEGLTQEEQRGFTQDVRGAQGARGFGLVSGAGAQQEFEKLTELRQELKTRRLNIALSTAGRAPVQGATQQQTNFGPSQLVQNATPSQIFGLQAQNNSLAANQQGGSLGGAGAAIGMGLGALLAAPTGGASLAAAGAVTGGMGAATGAMIGGGIGGGIGSMFQL